jgi:hypothetical protein
LNRFLTSALLLSAALLASLYGCSGGGQTLANYFYRFTNSIPDLAGVDWFLDDNLETSNQAYLQSSSYVEVVNEETLAFFDAFEAGTQNVIDAVVIQKEDEMSSHLFTLGLRTPGSQQPAARILHARITRTTPPGSNARIIFVHGYARAAGVQTPAVDIYRTGRISAELENLGFGDAQEGQLAAGSYDFTVRIAGTQQGSLIVRNGLVLEAGKIYILLLKGIEGQGGLLTPDILQIEEPVNN